MGGLLTLVRFPKVVDSFLCLPLWGRGTIRRMVDEENGLKKTFRYADTRQGGESELPSRKVDLHMLSSSTASRSPFSRGEGKGEKTVTLLAY